MQTIALIGFLGGLITGISPCILPVLPVILLSGMDSSRADARSVKSATRPYLVIAGLVCSFSLAMLIGSALLTALHLPQDAIRWAALVVLVLIGLGLIFPPVQHLLERPFAYFPQRQIGSGTDGFGLGLTLGALYVPCAGPVLAAIVVAGGTSSIGPGALQHRRQVEHQRHGQHDHRDPAGDLNDALPAPERGHSFGDAPPGQGEGQQRQRVADGERRGQHQRA
ncbi:cytochrome c biogenesis CcdA family protein, partial [Mycobacterium colombiense]|uniref:cytochrome c biogenesis CcdA family protein n=1 Tax=Mycobacterium colombiense TaxID=339268 RepID=UPI000B02D50F